MESVAAAAPPKLLIPVSVELAHNRERVVQQAKPWCSRKRLLLILIAEVAAPVVVIPVKAELVEEDVVDIAKPRRVLLVILSGPPDAELRMPTAAPTPLVVTNVPVLDSVVPVARLPALRLFIKYRLCCY